MKIALIPIDNRPVCYNLAKEIADIDGSLELILPERRFLGGLSSNADVDAVYRWLCNIPDVDAIVVSLDTIAHGGLIPSRRSKDSLEEIKNRLQKFKDKFREKSNGNVYAFSSVMRISNNNVNEEEKEYWKDYGTRIFEYSHNFHQNFSDETDLPDGIINDYLSTRNRNFQVNKMYIDWASEGIFNTLVFSKDDCAQFGLNVLESQILDKFANEKNVKAFVKTGADEIPLTLLARAVCNLNNASPKISARFLAPMYKNLISKYEDISIEKSVKGQIELAGCQYAKHDKEDIELFVNNFEQGQGEIVMGVKTLPFSGQFNLSKKPYIIADVRNANGADNIFVDKLLKKNLDFDNFYGFSAWNTSANTLGSLICAAIVRFFAKDYNDEAFRKLQMVRFLDDWAYQANVRQAMKAKSTRPDFRKLEKLMVPFEKKLQKILLISPKIKYKFPWKRFFEVEIIIR